MDEITSDMSVEYILKQWPETAVVFTQDLKTACVGCPIAPFDTLTDVAQIYEFDLEYIVERLCAVVNESKVNPME